VQGTPVQLAVVTGRRVRGAPAREDTVHPFRKSLAELQIGKGRSPRRSDP